MENLLAGGDSLAGWMKLLIEECCIHVESDDYSVVAGWHELAELVEGAEVANSRVGWWGEYYH